MAIKLGDNGDVKPLDMNINADMAEKILTRLKEDIYDFGGGVDQSKATIGNQSGVALKFLYAGLDLIVVIWVKTLELG